MLCRWDILVYHQSYNSAADLLSRVEMLPTIATSLLYISSHSIGGDVYKRILTPANLN
jgi:hypothetical protein